MSQKAKKEANKDDAITAAPVANMAALTKLLEEHRLALFMEFKLATTPLHVKLECVQVAVTNHGHCLTSLEEQVTRKSDKMYGG